MLYIYAIAALLLIYALFILPTQWLKIERIRHPLNLNKKIVQISDLHAEKLRVSPVRLLALIRRESPDYIFVTGDFTRNERFIARVEPYLRMLALTGIPVYAVLGNHDYKMRKTTRLLQTLRSFGICVLRNESAAVGQFQLVGIDDFSSGKSNIARAFQNVEPGKPVVVITHDPNVIPKINMPFDYLMCGHLHGKQFNIPFFFKIKDKGELPAQGIYKGLHHLYLQRDRAGGHQCAAVCKKRGNGASFIGSEAWFH
jgi:predicted MPP superfamily phosphohydrolase